jgi:hypothetical protein
LPLQWWGLEQDRQPLALALASAAFRSQWSEATLSRLEALGSSERLLWGDARQAVSRLPAALQGGCDLVWLDAFSPRRCPQLWSLEFLAQLAALLKPQFHKYDVDHDGKISVVELHMLLSDVGERLTINETRQWMERLDPDRSGEIEQVITS